MYKSLGARVCVLAPAESICSDDMMIEIGVVCVGKAATSRRKNALEAKFTKTDGGCGRWPAHESRWQCEVFQWFPGKEMGSPTKVAHLETPPAR